MGIIAIFCDGTWNRLDGAHRTHVARLAEACARTPSQKVLYLEGVGTGTGMVSVVGRWASRLGGGMFGWGLNRNIKLAYLHLCRSYEPGDKIMVFGFSRGAYTARSLVGMIRKCGILDDPTAENVDRAFRLYRLRGSGNAPDEPHILSARRVLSPHVSTSPSEVMQRADGSYLVRVAYLGVWDTVGALGVPKSILGPVARLWNARYDFHDTTLSRLVESARHAVALDERRALFEPGLWNNLDPSDGRPGLNRGDTGPERRYQQMWFAGSHGIVGGSTPPEGLAAASAKWILVGAEAAGLRLAPGRQIPDVGIDALAPAPDLYRLGRVYRFTPWLLAWRAGPSQYRDLHPSARTRAALDTGYLPASLRRLLGQRFQSGR